MHFRPSVFARRPAPGALQHASRLSLHVSAVALALAVAGCASDGTRGLASATPSALPPVDVVLIGERHDAPGQPALAAEAVRSLVAARRLSAVALEMAPAGATTVALPADASEAAVRSALGWDSRAWPWERYAPVVMAAVAARVPVIGANLPAAQMRTAMADVSLDAQLDTGTRALLETAIRDGHCNLLPDRQIGPMTRVQVARDRAMAHAVAESVRPGQTVVLLSGAGHADRRLGVPQHLPTQLKLLSVAMVAAGDEAAPAGAFDTAWPSPAAPQVDACAPLRGRPGAAG